VEKQSYLKEIAVLALILLSGCASLPNATTGAIDQRRVEFALSQQGTIPVVFENGLAGRMEWWQKVIAALPNTTTFAYNRPGYGQSTLVSTPRDGAHIVDELRQLLHSQGLQPPYILVGHSLGGLYMQLFTRLYPDEVAALVLVDSTHPQQLEGEGALARQSFWVRAYLQMAVTGAAREELERLTQTGAQVLGLPAPPDKPVLVLSASAPLQQHSAVADDANAKRRDIVRLYPGAMQIWVDSGHAIPLEKPEAVISAVREALLLVRSRSVGASNNAATIKNAETEDDYLNAFAL
jgi:pimeloyl-ACP methyl ester carboxylesterase